MTITKMKTPLFLLLCMVSCLADGRYLGEKTHQIKEARQVEGDRNVLDNIVNRNRETDANYFEGDIDVGNSFEPGIDFSKNGDIDGKKVEEAIQKRNAQRHRAYLWPSKRVPYVISPELYEHESIIKTAFKEFESKTCIQFVPYNGERDYLRFVKKNGCYSSVGRVYWTPGAQDVSLGEGCYYTGTIIHELTHAIGFWHEQSRPNRNQYIEVMWENIEAGAESNFNKYNHDNTDSLVEYDYGSIMHYGKFAFSKNGKETIRTIQSTEEIGQRQGFSARDIQEINILYDCTNPNSYGWSSWSSWGPCDQSCKRRRQRFCPDQNIANCPEADEYRIGTDTEQCSYEICYAPVNGHWGRWESWGACSASCDSGTQTRTRKCDDPAPSNRGNSCQGSAVETTSCKLQSCGGGPDDCEFETDMCHWSNVNTDDVDWHRITGATPTSNTGPEKDHSSGSGYYVYFEASAPTQSNNKAQLESQTMTGSAKRCLKFWYHMYGSGMGHLRVFRKSSSGSLKMLWEKNGDQGNKWVSEEITYDGQLDHRIIFEAQRASSFRSDIGLDDITFKEHACGETEAPIGSTTTGACSSALGMESGAIEDSQLTATSIYDANHAPFYGRLNNRRVWCVSHSQKDSKTQYIQITFKTQMRITAIATQGQSSWDNWVTSYLIKYSQDGLMYSKYHENDQVLIFQGNRDRNSVVKQILAEPITARYVRISPQGYYGTDSCMRLELYGCPSV